MVKWFLCNFEGTKCKAKFKKENKLKRHIQCKHLNLRLFKCTFDILNCNKTYKRKDHLQRHINSVHKKEKLFKCNYTNCNLRFNQKYHLNRHIKCVHGPPQYKCQFCMDTHTAVSSQGIEIGCVGCNASGFANDLCAKTNVGIAEIVTENKDDVRTPKFLRKTVRRDQAQEYKQTRQGCHRSRPVCIQAKHQANVHTSQLKGRTGMQLELLGPKSESWI